MCVKIVFGVGIKAMAEPDRDANLKECGVERVGWEGMDVLGVHGGGSRKSWLTYPFVGWSNFSAKCLGDDFDDFGERVGMPQEGP